MLFYKSAKAAAKEGAEDAERIAKDLSYHYKKQRSAKTETEDTDNTTLEKQAWDPMQMFFSLLPDFPLFPIFVYLCVTSWLKLELPQKKILSPCLFFPIVIFL